MTGGETDCRGRRLRRPGSPEANDRPAGRFCQAMAGTGYDDGTGLDLPAANCIRSECRAGRLPALQRVGEMPGRGAQCAPRDPPVV